MGRVPVVEDALAHAPGVVEGRPPVHHDLEPALAPGRGPHRVVHRQTHAPLPVLDERLRRDRVVVALDPDPLNLDSFRNE